MSSIDISLPIVIVRTILERLVARMHMGLLCQEQCGLTFLVTQHRYSLTATHGKALKIGPWAQVEYLKFLDCIHDVRARDLYF